MAQEQQSILNVSLADYKRQIDNLRASLIGLDKTSQQYQDTVKEIRGQQQQLNEVMAIGQKDSEKTLQQQLREERNKLSLMKEGTAEYEQQLKVVGALQDKFVDMRAAIKNAADDARLLNTAIDIARVGTSMFGIWTSAASLFGAENEKVVETIKKLQVATTLLTSLKQAQLLLFDRGSRIFQLYRKAVVALTGAEKSNTTATEANAAAQTANATATGAATTATNSFKKALIATGIGAFVVLLGTLIANWDKLTEALGISTSEEKKFNKELEESQKKLTETTNQALAPMLTSYKQLQTEWKTLSTEQQKREWIEKNKTEFENLGISINDVNDAEKWMVEKTEDVVKALMARARAAAYQKKMEDDYLALIEAQQEAEKAQAELDKQKASLASAKAANTGQAVGTAGVDLGSSNVSHFQGKVDEAQKNVDEANKKVETLNKNIEDGAKAALDATEEENRLLEGGVTHSAKRNAETKKGVDLKEEEIKALKKQAAEDEKIAKQNLEAAKNQAQLEYLNGLITEDEYKKRLHNANLQYEADLGNISFKYKDVEELRVKYSDMADEQCQKNTLEKAQQTKTALEKQAKESADRIKNEFRDKLANIDINLDIKTNSAETQFEMDTMDWDNGSLRYIKAEQELEHQLFDMREAARQEEKAAIEQAYTERVQLAAGNAEEIEKLTKKKNAAIAQIELDGQKDSLNLMKKDKKATADSVKAKKEQYKQLAASIQSLMGTINDIMTENLRAKVENGEMSEEEAEKEFERQKTLQYGMALLSTIGGAAEAYETAQRLGPPMGPIIGAINMAAALATGMAQVMQIKNSKFGQESSASASAASTPTVQDVSVSPILNEKMDVQTMTAMNVDKIANNGQNTRVWIAQSDLEKSGKQVEIRQSETSF